MKEYITFLPEKKKVSSLEVCIIEISSEPCSTCLQTLVKSVSPFASCKTHEFKCTAQMQANQELITKL